MPEVGRCVVNALKKEKAKKKAAETGREAGRREQRIPMFPQWL